MRKILADDVLDRLIPALGLKNDSELAKRLDTAPSTISSWRKRDSVPFAICATFAQERGWSLDWLMFGEGEMYKSVQASNAVPENQRERALLELFRALGEDQQREIQGLADDKKRLMELELRLEELERGRRAS